MRSNTLERLFAFFKASLQGAKDWFLDPDPQRPTPTALEKRVLLSGTVVDPGPDVVFSSGDCGDDGTADTFTLETVMGGAAEELQIRFNDGTTETTFNLGLANSITSVRLLGSTDQDTFIINSDVTLSGGVSVVGGGGADEVQIQETGGSPPSIDSIDYDVGDSSTSVTIDRAVGPDLVVNVQSVPTIVDNLTAGSKSVSISGTTAELEVTEADLAGTSRVTVDLGSDLSVATDLSLDFISPGVSLDFDLDNASTQNLALTGFDNSSIDLTVLGTDTDSLEVGTTSLINVESLDLSGDTIAIDSSISTTSGDLEISGTTSIVVDSTGGNVSLSSVGGSVTLTGEFILGGGSLVTLDSDGGVSLTNVTGLLDGSVADLTVISDDGISFSSIDLGDATAGSAGVLTLKVNDDNDSANNQQLVIDSSSALGSIGTLDLSGTATGDTIVINSDVTTSVGGIVLQNAAVTIGANLTAATSISQVGVSSTTLNTTSGDIQLQSLNGSVGFVSDVAIAGGNTATLRATNGDVSLQNVTGVNDGLSGNLSVIADDAVSFTSIDLSDSTAAAGALSIQVNADAGTAAGESQQILITSSNLGAVGALTLAGTAAGDTILISGDVSTETGGISLQNAGITIGANLSAATSISVSSSMTTTIDSSAGNVGLESLNGGIGFGSNLQLAGGNTVTLASTNGGVTLLNVSGVADSAVANLSIISGIGISFTNIDLNDAVIGANGALALQVNADDDSANVQQISLNSTNLSAVGALTLSGSVAGDSIVIADDIATTAGGIALRNAGITIGGNLTSATSILIEGSSGVTINGSSGAIQLLAQNGGISSDSDFILQGGNTISLTSQGGGVSLGGVTGLDDSATAGLNIVSDDGIDFTSIDLADATLGTSGDLTLQFNADADDTDPQQLLIDSSSTLGAIGSLTASGTAAGDSIAILSDVSTDSGSIDLNTAVVTIGANLSAATFIDVDNTATVTLDTSSGDIQLQSSSGNISFNSNVSLAGGNTATLDADGGNVNLVNVNGANDGSLGNLTVVSDDAINFTRIDLSDSTASSAGDLSLQVNADGDTGTGTEQIQINSSNLGSVGALTLSGTVAGDSITVGTDVTTLTGGILLKDAGITISGNLTAATSIAFQNSTGVVVDNSAGSLSFESLNGGISSDSNLLLAGGNTLSLTATGGGVSLTNVTDVDDGAISNFTVVSDDGISFTNIDLEDSAAGGAGALTLTINADLDSGNLEQLNITDSNVGALGALTLSGSVSGDSINVSKNVVTSTGGIILRNAEVTVSGNLTSATSIAFSNSNSVVLDGSSGDLAIQSRNGAITSDSPIALGGGSTITFDADGGGVSLTNVSGLDDGSEANLIINSDEGISFSNIDLGDASSGSAGALSLTVNTDGLPTDLTGFQQLVIDSSSSLGALGSVTLSGTVDGDTVVVNSDIVTSVGDIQIRNASVIGASLTSATSIDVDSVGDLTLATDSGDIQLQSLNGDVSFDSNILLSGGNTATIDSGGGSVNLINVTGQNDGALADLTVVSDDAINFSFIDLSDASAPGAGILSLQVNADGDTANVQQLLIDSSNLGSVGAITLSGTASGDTIVVATDIVTTSGGILIKDAGITVGSNLISAGSIEFQNSSGVLVDGNSGSRFFQALNGGITSDSDISLAGGSTITFETTGGGVSLTNVTEVDDGLVTNFSVSSADGISFTNIDLGDSASGAAGVLALTVNTDRDTSSTEQITVDSSSTIGVVGRLILSGSVDGDSIVIGSDVATTNDFIVLQNADISIGANVTAASFVFIDSNTPVTLDTSSSDIEIEANNGFVNFFGTDAEVAGGNTVTLDSDGSGVFLQNVTGVDDNATGNLTIDSEEGVSFTSIDLLDSSLGVSGALSITVNSDGVGTSQQILIDSTSSLGAIGSLTLSGASASDSIVINSGITTDVGDIDLQNATISIGASLNSAGAISTNSTSPVTIETRLGDIQLATQNGDITFDSDVSLAGANDASLISGGGSVNLRNLAGLDDNGVADLNVISDDAINFTNIDLLDATAGIAGSLSLQVNADGDTTNVQQILIDSTNLGTVGALSLSGTTAGDTISITTDVQTGVGGIVLQNAGITVSGNLTAATTLDFLNSSGVLIDGSGGSLVFTSQNGAITSDSELILGGGNRVILDANGGGVSLAAVSELDDGATGDFIVQSDEGIDFTNIDLGDSLSGNSGGLSLTVNTDGLPTDTTGFEQIVIDSGTTLSSIGSLTLSGTVDGDSIVITSDFSTDNGSITLQNATMTVGANLTAATSIAVSSNSSITLDSTSSDIQLQSLNGSIDLNSDALIAGGNRVTLATDGGSVGLTSVAGLDDAALGDLTVISESGISFTSIDLFDRSLGLAGDLQLTVNSEGNPLLSQALVIGGSSVLGSVGNLGLSGGGLTAGDLLFVTQDLVASSGSIVVENFSNVFIDASQSNNWTASNGDVQINSEIGNLVLVDTDPASTSLNLSVTANSGTVQLTDVVSTTGSSLTVNADQGVDLEGVQLSGTDGSNSLIVNYDTDGSGSEQANLGGEIIVSGAVSVAGAANSDQVNISNNISASSIGITQTENVVLDSSLGASLTLNADGGNIDLASGVTAVQLVGDSETITIDSNADGLGTGAGNISVANVTSTGNHHFRLLSEEDVTTADITLSDSAALTIQIDSDGDNTSADRAVLTVDGTNGIEAGTISIAGIGMDDIAIINTDIQSTSGSLAISDLSLLAIRQEMSAQGDLAITDVETTTLDLSINRTYSSASGGVSIGSGFVVLQGDGTQASIIANGGDVVLGMVTADRSGVSPDLQVLSNQSIEFVSIDLDSFDAALEDGNLVLQVNKDSGAAQTLNLSSAGTSRIGTVASIDLSAGGSGLGDAINIQGALATTGGSINIHDVDSVVLNEASIVATGGDLLITDDVGLIGLSSGAGSTSTLVSRGGLIQLTDVQDVSGGAQGNSLALSADLGGSIESVNLSGTSADGALSVAFGGSGTSTFTFNEAVENVSAINVTGQTDPSAGSTVNNLQLNGRLATTSGQVSFSQLASIEGSSIVVDSVGSISIGSDIDVDGTNGIYLETDQNLAIGDRTTLEIANSSGFIRGIAAGNVTLGNGALVSRPTSDGGQVVVSNLPGDVMVTPQISEDGISNISSLGEANLDVVIGTAGLDRNFTFTVVNAEDNEVLFDNRVEGDPFEATSFVVPLQFDVISGSAPLGDRDVVVTLQSDINNQIQFIGNNTVLTTTTQTIRLEAPVDGFITPVTIEAPESPRLQAADRIGVQGVEFVDPFAPLAVENEPELESIAEAQVGQQRKYVLKLVVDGGADGKTEDIKIEDLPDDILEKEKLDQLFESLTNDRYRIYLVLEDGSEQSVLDVSLNEQEVIELDDAGDSKKLRILKPLDTPSEDNVAPGTGEKTPENALFENPDSNDGLPALGGEISKLTEEPEDEFQRLLLVGKYAVEVGMSSFPRDIR